jgi:hypothetical protein
MIERSRAALAPTPTPVPPTATPLPIVPTATPVPMSSQTPDAELGHRYFGEVTLAMVPGRDADAPAATQFFFQDQIGLHIEGLKQHLRLPFTLRVFNTDTKRLVAEVQSDNTASVAATVVAAGVGTTTSGQRVSVQQAMAAVNAQLDERGPFTTPTSVPTTQASTAPEIRLSRFWDTYVWYHKGGEEPGHYRAELYASGILTNLFDYTIGTEPVPTPEPVQPTAEPTAEPTATAVPSLQADMPPPAPVVSRPRTSSGGSGSAPVQAPEPTPLPSPTPVPTPATAGVTMIGGLPAGLDINPNDGRVYIADGSGVIWTTDPQRPNKFNIPVNLDRLPVDLAVDQNTGYVFVSARSEASVLVMDGSGRRLSTIPMPVAPGDLAVDSNLGLVFVVLPERQALGVIDGRAGRLLRTIPGLPQITSLALDPDRHVLYASHLGGQLTIIDVPSSQLTARITLTGVGLSSVATSRGLAYAVNTASHELAVVEPVSQGVIRYVLPAEPAAVAASENSGSIYVLSSRPNTILRLDPTNGSELGRVTLPDRSGRFGVADKPDFRGLRSRMVVSRIDESLYLTLPEAGSLSVVPTAQFPPMTHEIPWVETPENPVVAETIPGVIRPGAPPLPDQPAPLRAQAPVPSTEEAN